VGLFHADQALAEVELNNPDVRIFKAKNQQSTGGSPSGQFTR
jgi:hypothetical protein